MTTAAVATMAEYAAADAPVSSSARERNHLPPPAPKNGDDEDDGQDSYEDFFDASLFLNEDYVSVSVPFGEIEEEKEEEDEEEQGQERQERGEVRRRRSRFSLDLLCSQAASTYFNLTGQILWPGAALIAGYLVAGEGDGEKKAAAGAARSPPARARRASSEPAWASRASRPWLSPGSRGWC